MIQKDCPFGNRCANTADDREGQVQGLEVGADNYRLNLEGRTHQFGGSRIGPETGSAIL